MQDKENDHFNLIWANYHSGEFATVLAQMEALPMEGIVLKIKGLAHFQMGEYDKALDALQAYAQTTDAALDWFSLSTTAAMAKQPSLALEAFNQCIAKYPNSEPAPALSLPLLHWYFLKAMLSAGFGGQVGDKLVFLVDCYIQAKITDAHYLTTRGLPDWEDFLEVFWPLRETLSKEDSEALLYRLREGVDAPGRATLKQKS